MRLEIRVQGLPGSGEIRLHVQRRLGFALGRFSNRIDRVQVRLTDVNGPRGGADKRCRIRVVGPGLGDVVVEEHDQGLREAVDRAASRVARNVARALGRGPRSVVTGTA